MRSGFGCCCCVCLLGFVDACERLWLHGESAAECELLCSSKAGTVESVAHCASRTDVFHIACWLHDCYRLRQKYEAWSKQFKQRMREAQAALRRKQGGSGPLPYSSSNLQNAHSADSQDLTGVPGLHSMVGHSAADMVAVPKPPQPQQQPRPHHIVHAHAAMPAGPDAAVTVGPPSSKSFKSVDVRKMPDLNAPDLLGTERSSESGSDGGKKKKGVFSRVFG